MFCQRLFWRSNDSPSRTAASRRVRCMIAALKLWVDIWGSPAADLSLWLVSHSPPMVWSTGWHIFTGGCTMYNVMKWHMIQHFRPKNRHQTNLSIWLCVTFDEYICWQIFKGNSYLYFSTGSNWLQDWVDQLEWFGCRLDWAWLECKIILVVCHHYKTMEIWHFQKTKEACPCNAYLYQSFNLNKILYDGYSFKSHLVVHRPLMGQY